MKYIAKSIDGYNAGDRNEDDGKRFEKEVFTYGIVNIKKEKSLLVCIDVKDYETEKFEKAFPVLLENVLAFEILENKMRYAKT